jgi:lipopolysaccharide export LptBFGC system permease protein LptF
VGEEKVPYDGPERREDTSVEITGPGGLRAIVRSPSSAAVLLVVIAAWFGWISYQSNVQANERTATMITRVERMEKALGEFKQSQDLLIYVISLSDEERKNLKIRQPRGLEELQR